MHIGVIFWMLHPSVQERLQEDLMAWVDRQGLQDFHGPVGDEDEDEEEEDSDMAADDESQEGLLGVIEKLRRDEAFATEEAVEELDDDEALRKHRRKTSAAAEELLKQLKELAQVAGCPEPDGCPSGAATQLLSRLVLLAGFALIRKGPEYAGASKSI